MKLILLGFFVFVILLSVAQRGSVRWVPEFSIVVSMVAIYFVLYPTAATVVANSFGVGRGTDLLLYLCFVVVGVSILFLGYQLKRAREDLTELARYTALNTATKRNIPDDGQDCREVDA